MEKSLVKIERKGRVAILRLDRAERKNAFNETMWTELDHAVAAMEGNLPGAVVVTGAGENVFSTGVDVNPDNPQIKGVMDAVFANDRKPVESLISTIRHTTDRLFALPVPIIAALNGAAYGGGAELAVRCDMRVMDPAAVICFSEVRLGLMPDWGGGVALARLLGPAVAGELVLTARPVAAAEALKLGLVNRISESGCALEEALELAETIARNGPRAVRAALEVIRKTPGLSDESALALEFEQAVALIASGECVHGIGAFMSREEPKFPDV